LSNENFGAAAAFDGGDGIIGASGYELGQGAVYLAGNPPPEVPPEPAFPPTGELAVTGGTIEGPGGVLLGTVGTPLEEPLPVWIHEVPPPAKALSSQTKPLGPFYKSAPSRRHRHPLTRRSAWLLPVPADADTAHLAVAILIGALDDSDDLWTPMQGLYNAEFNLFSIGLPALFIEGSTVVLIEDPDLAPLSAEATPSQRSGEDTPTFAIKCQSSLFTDPSKCQPHDETKMNLLMQDAHDDYVSLGYEKPALNITGTDITVTEGNGHSI
jgi:hypothetical protein